MSEKEELVAIVGAENVFDDPDSLEMYSRDMSFTPPRKPDYVVEPKNAEEVQALVKWANKTGTPLIPVSSGPPRFRGDTVPRFGGVIVDLSGMNKIIRVDRPDRVAMVEPGVRWGKLQEAVKQEGMRVPMPLCPRNSKSVVGSCLEREPHVIPKYHLDHSEPLLCAEVVYGTGDIYRTGEAAGPGTIEEQWKAGRYQKQQMGVQMDEFRLLQCAQGTMGIVTWATVRCEVLPTIKKPFIASSDRVEDLLNLAYRLVRLRLGDELFILNNQNMALLLGDSAQDIETLRETIPPWNLFFCIAGYEHLAEERVDYQEKDIAEIAKDLGVKYSAAVPGVSASELLKAVTKPSGEPFWKLKYKGGCQDIFFITALDNISRLVGAMNEMVARKGYPSPNMGIYIQPVCQGHGHHCEFSLTYDPDSQLEKAKVKDLYISASESLMNNGAFFSRPYDFLTDMVFNRDGASRDALRKIKSVYDPNNIMNPGKLCF